MTNRLQTLFIVVAVSLFLFGGLYVASLIKPPPAPAPVKVDPGFRPIPKNVLFT